MRRGERLTVMAMTFVEDLYGVARMRVPHRPSKYPGGLDCDSADDVFRLYWRYTSPDRMGYMSWTSRKLHKFSTHEEKVLSELAIHKVGVLVLEKDKKIPDWARGIIKTFKNAGTIVMVPPVRGLPPGIDPDAFNYYEKKAWRLLYSYLRTLSWPNDNLEIFSAPGTGKDVSTGTADKKRAGLKPVKVGDEIRQKTAARLPTQEEIDQLLTRELDPDALVAEVKFSAHGRTMVVAAGEEGLWRWIEEQHLAKGDLTKEEVAQQRADRIYNRQAKVDQG